MNHIHTILAALRCYQQHYGEDADIEDLATDGGRQPLLSEEDICDLCERLNCGHENLPEIPPFTDTELDELMEAARVAMQDLGVRQRLSDTMDLSEGYLARLHERLRNYLDHAAPASVRGKVREHIVCEIICQKPSVSLHATEEAALEHAVQCAMENMIAEDDETAAIEKSKEVFRDTLKQYDCIREGDYEVYLLSPVN